MYTVAVSPAALALCVVCGGGGAVVSAEAVVGPSVLTRSDPPPSTGSVAFASTRNTGFSEDCKDRNTFSG